MTEDVSVFCQQLTVGVDDDEEALSRKEDTIPVLKNGVYQYGSV